MHHSPDRQTPERDPVAESNERQDRFFRENPPADGEPEMSFDERWELTEDPR